MIFTLIYPKVAEALEDTPGYFIPPILGEWRGVAIFTIQQFEIAILTDFNRVIINGVGSHLDICGEAIAYKADKENLSISFQGNGMPYHCNGKAYF